MPFRKGSTSKQKNKFQEEPMFFLKEMIPIDKQGKKKIK